MEEQRKAASAAPETQCKGTENSAKTQGSYLNILAGVRQEQEIFSAKNLGFDEYEICLAEKLAEPIFTVKSLGAGAFPLGDIQAIKAKSKSGKTYAASIIAAVMLGVDFGTLKAGVEGAKVLFFDTEQNKLNTAKVMRRIHSLLGWDDTENTDRLHVYSLRRMDLAERCEYIAAKVQAYKPTAVIIDGVADLMLNFNDVEESSRLIDWLMKLSADNNCALIAVLHENKSKDDNGMKGHLGTLLLQKSSDVFQCSKANGVFTVTETDSRNLPIEDFSFFIDGHGIPHPAQSMADRKTDTTREKIRKVLQEVYQDSGGLTYSELVAAYSLHAACSERTAKRNVATAKEMGLISVGYEGRYECQVSSSAK